MSQTQTPATQSTNLLAIAPESNINIELNGERIAQDQVTEALRSYVRGKIAKQYGVAEIKGLDIKSGKLFFNEQRTPLTLPKPLTESGIAIEPLATYYERCKPAIKIWLARAIHNSRNITAEAILGIN
jgi:hypothetical protein